MKFLILVALAVVAFNEASAGGVKGGAKVGVGIGAGAGGGRGGAGVGVNIGIGGGVRMKKASDCRAADYEAALVSFARNPKSKKAIQFCTEWFDDAANAEASIQDFVDACVRAKLRGRFTLAIKNYCGALGIEVELDVGGALKSVTKAAVQAVQKVLKLVQGILAKVLGQLSAFLQEKLPEIAGVTVSILNALLPHVIAPLAECVPGILELVGLIIAECPNAPNVNNETATSRNVEFSTQGAHSGHKW